MAVIVFGTAHLFGISGTIANATVQSFSNSESFALAEETKDEDGVTIERHYNDTTDEASISIKIQAAYTVPSVGDTLTYDSLTYEITNVNESQENQGFRSIELSLKKSEGITYA